MLIKTADHGLIQGLLPEVHEGGIINLQFADDALLFFSKKLNTPAVLELYRLLLYCVIELLDLADPSISVR